MHQQVVGVSGKSGSRSSTVAKRAAIFALSKCWDVSEEIQVLFRPRQFWEMQPQVIYLLTEFGPPSQPHRVQLHPENPRPSKGDWTKAGKNTESSAFRKTSRWKDFFRLWMNACAAAAAGRDEEKSFESADSSTWCLRSRRRRRWGRFVDHLIPTTCWCRCWWLWCRQWSGGGDSVKTEHTHTRYLLVVLLLPRRYIDPFWTYRWFVAPICSTVLDDEMFMDLIFWCKMPRDWVKSAWFHRKKIERTPQDIQSPGRFTILQ